MKNIYLSSFAVAGVLWIACLVACFVGLRLIARRPARSIRKALALCVLSLVVSALGAHLLKLHFDYSSQTYIEGSSQVVGGSHWHIESWWFFRVSEIVAGIASAIAVVVWFNATRKPNQTLETNALPPG